MDWLIGGRKRYEGRLMCKIKEWKLAVGDHIWFTDFTPSVETSEHPHEHGTTVARFVITSLVKYTTFGHAYDDLGDELIPNSDRATVVRLYNKIFKIDGEEWDTDEPVLNIRTNGVVCIGVKLVEDFVCYK